MAGSINRFNKALARFSFSLLTNELTLALTSTSGSFLSSPRHCSIRVVSSVGVACSVGQHISRTLECTRSPVTLYRILGTGSAERSISEGRKYFLNSSNDNI
uniref:Uncharacterized protein n=1 Tax=Cacopsylla melanoneura TaxID=428564 RepID=A0A8D8Y0A7_9HEMI